MLVKFCGVLMLLLIATFLAPFSHGLRCHKCTGYLDRRDDECHKVELGKDHPDYSWDCGPLIDPGPWTCLTSVSHKNRVVRNCLQNAQNRPLVCRDVPNPGRGELYECLCTTDNCNAKQPGTIPPPGPNANGTAVAQWKTYPNKSNFFVLTTTLITILIHLYIQ